MIEENYIGFAAFDPFKSLHRLPENNATEIDAVADIFNVAAAGLMCALASIAARKRRSFRRPQWSPRPRKIDACCRAACLGGLALVDGQTGHMGGQQIAD